MNATAALRAAAAAVLFVLAAPLEAETTTFLYAVNPSGKLTVNGTVLEELPGAFTVEDGYFSGTDDAWVALDVEGADRYSLRYDGVVRKNGKKVHALPFSARTRWSWLDAEEGHDFCIRSDGLLCLDGKAIAELPGDAYPFRRVVAFAGRAYSLRSDGALFRDAGTSPVGRFLGGPGRGTGFPDGTGNDSAWVDATIDPSVPEILALRGDGIVQSIALADLGGPVAVLGTEEAALPFVYDLDADGDETIDPYPMLDDAYFDIEVDGTYGWLALAGDGRVYGRDAGLIPVDDFPGNASDPASAFGDLVVLGADHWALRGDGRVFRSGVDEPVLSLAGLHYGFLAVSDTPPDLGSFDEHKPKVVTFDVTVVVGTPVDLSTMATDIETRSAELVVTPGELPADDTGSTATWDDEARTMRWDAPQAKGNYKFQVTVTDGNTTVKITHKIHVVEADAVPEKNKKPALPGIKNGRPVIGQPFEFPVILDDRDGDSLVVNVDLADYPFTAGATFDPTTRVFSWTPGAEDQGDRKVKFQVFDGTATQTKTVTLKVRAGLIF